jgi:signal transduction histidine kinase
VPSELNLTAHVAEHLTRNARGITRAWIERLDREKGESSYSEDSPDSLLDADSRIVERVAHLIADSELEPVDAAVRRHLGARADLRRRQGLVVSQLLSEFAVLSALMSEATAEALEEFEGPVDPGELLRISGSVTQALSVFAQETAERSYALDSRRMAERMKAVEAYTAALSHELHNRLGAADTAATLLLEAGPEMEDPRRRRLHELLSRSIRGGLQTISSVRALFDPAAENDTPRTLPLYTVLRNLIRQSRIPAGARGIDVEVTGVTPRGAVDAERFPLVLLNLLLNAVKHHDAKPGTGRVRVDVDEEDEAWVFTVEDDGPGIPPEAREELFRAYTRGTRDRKGSGLGLAIAREAVEQMGGAIALTSGEGRGATFRFTVPKEPDEDPQARAGIGATMEASKGRE